jgi:hypothetical protein
MTNKKKTSAADLLYQQINSAKPKPNPKITDPFATEVAKRLEQRSITKVPGLPDDEPEPQWYDLVIEMERRHQEFLADREAKHHAEQQASLSTADLIRSTLCRNEADGRNAPQRDSRADCRTGRRRRNDQQALPRLGRRVDPTRLDRFCAGRAHRVTEAAEAKPRQTEALSSDERWRCPRHCNRSATRLA